MTEVFYQQEQRTFRDFDKTFAHKLRKNTDHMSILFMNTFLYQP